MLCTNRTLVKRLGHYSLAQPLRCRSWQCEYCQPRRKKQLREEFLRGNPTSLLTLTMRQGRNATPEQQAVELAKAWRRLRRALIKKFQLERLPFMCVFERHANGWPHLHILIRAPYISQRFISKWMAREYDSPIVDIRRVKGRRQAASYVTKYAAKAPERFEGVKRYWRSQDYFVRPKDDAHPSPRWDDIYVENCNWWLLGNRLYRVGYALSCDRFALWFYWPVHPPPNPERLYRDRS